MNDAVKLRRIDFLLTNEGAEVGSWKLTGDDKSSTDVLKEREKLAGVDEGTLNALSASPSIAPDLRPSGR
jgi:hypothetical protein